MAGYSPYTRAYFFSEQSGYGRDFSLSTSLFSILVNVIIRCIVWWKSSCKMVSVALFRKRILRNYVETYVTSVPARSLSFYCRKCSPLLLHILVYLDYQWNWSLTYPKALFANQNIESRKQFWNKTWQLIWTHCKFFASSSKLVQFNVSFLL